MPPLSGAARPVDGVGTGPWRQAVSVRGHGMLREAVDGELMHRFRDPFNGCEFVEGEPSNRGNFTCITSKRSVVGFNLVTKEDCGPVVAQRRANAGKTDDDAVQPRFFLKFPYGCGLWTFVGLNVTLWQPPPATVPPVGFLDQQDLAFSYNTSGNAKVTQQMGHRTPSVAHRI